MYGGVWGKALEAGEFSRIFVLQITLQSVRLLVTVSYRKKFGEQDLLVAPPIILLVAPPASPVPALMAAHYRAVMAAMWKK